MSVEQTFLTPSEQLVAAANQRLKQASEMMHFIIATSINPCPTGSGQPGSVDLVALMDMSGSMADEAKPLSAKLEALITTATANCRSDLRVVWLGIAGVRPKTQFTQTSRKYLLEQLNIPRKELESEAKDKEDGARSIIDLARHFDWRPNATRLILFLGDEGLYRGDPQTGQDVKQVDRAIAIAQDQRVTVFTYLGTPLGKRVNPRTRSEYQRVATATGGQAYVHPLENLNSFQPALADLICFGSMNCSSVAIPELQPCFELRWGDQPEDRLETNEVETLYLVACNPYANVTFKGLTVKISIKIEASSAQNGTFPISIIPSDPICFDDLSPCDPQQPEQLSCLARELVLISQGAASGNYLVEIDYTCSVEIMQRGADTFTLPLVTAAPAS